MLRVAVVGGLTRATHEWTRAGEALGIHLEHHDGNTTGCRAATLAAMVRRADIVVAITIPNSHNAVAIARRTAANHGRVLRIVKRRARARSRGWSPTGSGSSARARATMEVRDDEGRGPR